MERLQGDHREGEWGSYIIAAIKDRNQVFMNNMEKTRIINVLYHIPPYANYSSGPRPAVNWDLPDGNWAGIWGYDIPNLFGAEILKRNPGFDYEVWQPDLRADKAYSHRFANGVMHKLFPAETITRIHGIKKVQEVSSAALIGELGKAIAPGTVIHLNAVSGVLNEEIIRQFPDVPKVINFHSLISAVPWQGIFKPRKNLLFNLQNIVRHRELKRNKKVVFTYNNSRNIALLGKYPSLGVERVFTSIDFGYWVPGNKSQAKARFNIDASVPVFTLASRLNPLKQVDKVIQTFAKIEKADGGNFCLLIAGNGEEAYMKYLHQIAADLEKRDKARFVGYLTGDEMRTLYQASDLFISSSTSEGGPTSLIKALACQVPVFCTRCGGVDDYIEKYGGGALAAAWDYSSWEVIFRKVLLDTEKQVVFDRELAKDLFSWDTAANQYIRIYEKLSDSCYKNA